MSRLRPTLAAALLTGSIGCTPTAAHRGDKATQEQPIEGVVCPALALSATELVWVATAPGAEDTRTLMVENACNNGDDALELELAQDGGGSFHHDAPATASLAPGEALQIAVTFAPTTYDSDQGLLIIRAGSDDERSDVALVGGIDTDVDDDGDDAVAAGGGDCDDHDPWAHSKPVEDAQDGIDDDCDGTIDEDFVVAGDLIITEVMARPEAADDALGEWFEVYNPTDTDFDLLGWTLAADDGETIVLETSVVVPAGGFAVLGASAVPADNGGVGVTAVYRRDAFSLSDAADSIRLQVAGREVAAATWADGWPLEDGASLALDGDFTTPEHATEPAWWCASESAYGDGDRGTPGAANGRCATVDHDGDGASVADGDCDDDDPTRSPTIPEAWDGYDNDCDGVIDDMDTSSAVGSWDGTNQQLLSWSRGLAITDPNGDGAADLIVSASATGGSFSGTLYSGVGEVWAVSGADALTASGHPSDTAWLDLTGTGQSQRFGLVAPWSGDVDGDGIDDLVMAGNDAYGSGDASVALLLGDTGLSGSYDADDVDVILSGSASYADSYRAMGHADLDGDGFADVIYGNARGSVSSTWYCGRVFGFSGADLASGGDLDLEDDADMDLHSEEQSAALGAGMGAGDIDADGYDDLLVAAPGAKDGSAYTTGVIYILEGSSNPWSQGVVTNLSDWQLDGSTAGERLGDGQWIYTDDVDGDGQPDLLVGSPGQAVAYYIDDTTDLADREDIDRASDWTFEGDSGVPGFGFAVGTGDIDGDGAREIAVGAPGAANMNQMYAATVPGQTYVYDPTTLSGANIDVGQAAFTISGAATKDGFGAVLALGDLDGDLDAELVVGAPFFDGQLGGVSIFNP